MGLSGGERERREVNLGAGEMPEEMERNMQEER